MEWVFRIGRLSLEEAIAFPPQFLALIALPPLQQVFASFYEFGSDALDPLLVACVTVVLPKTPQGRAGLEHVTPKVLHEPVVVPSVQEVGQGFASVVVPPLDLLPRQTARRRRSR